MKIVTTAAEAIAPCRTLIEMLETIPAREPEVSPNRSASRCEIQSPTQLFHQEHPLGLRQSELNFDMEEAGRDESVFVVLAKRLYYSNELATFANSFYSWHEKAMAWLAQEPDFPKLGKLLHDYFSYFSLAWLTRHLSSGEIARCIHEGIFSGRINDEIYRHPYYMFADRLARSPWNWHTPSESYKLPWSLVAQFYKFFKAFDFALNGFDVTIDHTLESQDCGYGKYTGKITDPLTGRPAAGTWLDGELGLIVSRGGLHLLTIGVCTTAAGILLNQIQLKKKKGNRWLYELPKPYFEYTIERLLAACTAAGLPLFLVSGASHVAELRRLNPSSFKQDLALAPRIKAIYDQPFTDCKRIGRRFKVGSLTYRQVVTRPC